MLTCSQFRALQAAALRDPRPLIEASFDIAVAGDNPLIRLTLNGPQRKVHAAILGMREAGMPPRVITLKARQVGLSTLGEAYLLAMALCRPHSNSMVIAHVDDAAEKLFRKVMLMVERLPEYLRPRLRGTPRKDEITFDAMPCSDGEVELGSTVMIATAGGKEKWRSQTLHAVHFSEFSMYAGQAESVLLGALQSIPLTTDTLALIEATAFGAGNSFHKEFLRAEAGESDFRAVFIPWFERPEAHMTPPRDFELTEDERAIKRTFALSSEQMQWRRYMVGTACYGSVDKFHQEYPGTAAEAFLLSGMPAFDAKRLMEMQEKARTRKPTRGEMTDRGFIEMAKGRLGVWAFPDKDHDYAIGADVASGIEGGDYSCAQVIDRDTADIVATWHGHIGPIDFATVIARLGRWYNDAIVAPEINNHGYAVVEEMKRNFYPRWYVWQRVDKIRNTVTNFLGWETNTRTRGLMIDSMQHAIMDGELMAWDPETIRELMEFQWIDRRRAEGAGYDDRALALMIAWRAHLEMPLLKTGLPPKVFLPDDPKPPEDKPPMPRGLQGEIWEEVEREIQTLERGSPGQSWEEWGMPDPRAGEDEKWMTGWPTGEW